MRHEWHRLGHLQTEFHASTPHHHLRSLRASAAQARRLLRSLRAYDATRADALGCQGFAGRGVAASHLLRLLESQRTDVPVALSEISYKSRRRVPIPTCSNLAQDTHAPDAKATCAQPVRDAESKRRRRGHRPMTRPRIADGTSLPTRDLDVSGHGSIHRKRNRHQDDRIPLSIIQLTRFNREAGIVSAEVVRRAA